jgi:hypothetical protein
MEAREAADRIFAELPSNVETISLGDMANHLQEVMFVPYAEVIATRLITKSQSLAPPRLPTLNCSLCRPPDAQL